MNIKTISLLTSLVSLSTLHANTTKPSSETLYEKAANSAQKLTTGLRNLNPINAGCALLMALAANQTANYSLNQLVPTRQAAQQKLDKAEAEYTDKQTKFHEELKKNNHLKGNVNLQGTIIKKKQGLLKNNNDLLKQAQDILNLSLEKEKKQTKFEEQTKKTQSIKTQCEEAHKQFQEQKAKGIILAVPVLLLDVLSTKTASVAMWLNFYNMLQRHTGNKPLEVPLLNYFDFSACLASKTWSLSVNLTAALNYLFN